MSYLSFGFRKCTAPDGYFRAPPRKDNPASSNSIRKEKPIN
jgi:hypothetical protein